MFVSVSHGFVFLANQKCASTSVSRIIRASCTITPQTHKIITHNSYTRAVSILTEMEIDPLSLRAFTHIRNPWKRIVSFYQHIHNEESRNPFWAKVANEANDFGRFIKRVDVQARLQELSADHFCVDEASGRWVDSIFTMEKMHEELPPFLEEMGLPVPAFPHARNQGGSHDYRDWYDAASRDIVARLFASDVEIGGYTFG